MTSPLAAIYSSIDSVKRQLMDAMTSPLAHAQRSIAHGVESLQKYNEKSELAESKSVLIPQSQKDQAKKEVVDAMLGLLGGNAGIIVPKQAASAAFQKVLPSYHDPRIGREVVSIPDTVRGLVSDSVKKVGKTAEGREVLQIEPGQVVTDLLNRTGDLPPQLVDYLSTVAVRPTSGPYGSGAFSARDDYMELAPGTKEQLTSTLLHEVQHASQYIYDLPRGGSPKQFFQNFGKFDTAQTLVEQRLKDMGITTSTQLPQVMRSMPQQRNELMNSPETMQYIARILQQSRSKAFKNYENLGGEAEARAVQYLYENPRNQIPIPDIYKQMGLPRENQILPYQVRDNFVDSEPTVQEMINLVLGIKP